MIYSKNAAAHLVEIGDLRRVLSALFNENSTMHAMKITQEVTIAVKNS